MSNLLTAFSTGITAFSATNLDDIVILMLFFSQVSAVFRQKHIITGQYLGFAALVFASLPGFFGGMLVPQSWIGMLGIVPIAIGVSRLLNPDEEAEETLPDSANATSPLAGLFSPQTYSVAAVTVANGGDNVGIYVPLFASCTWESLVVVLSVFFALVAVWCYAARQLTRVPAIGEALTRYGNQLVPFVLMGLGTMILLESHTLEDRGLMMLTLLISGMAMITLRTGKTTEIEKSL